MADKSIFKRDSIRHTHQPKLSASRPNEKIHFEIPGQESVTSLKKLS